MTRTFLLPFALLFCTAGTSGQTTTHLLVEDLRQVRLPDVTLEKVESVTPDTRQHLGAVTHVRVLGVIGGHIRFELLLPDRWNQRFVMGGGGGFVG